MWLSTGECSLPVASVDDDDRPAIVSQGSRRGIPQPRTVAVPILVPRLPPPPRNDPEMGKVDGERLFSFLYKTWTSAVNSSLASGDLTQAFSHPSRSVSPRAHPPLSRICTGRHSACSFHLRKRTSSSQRPSFRPQVRFPWAKKTPQPQASAINFCSESSIAPHFSPIPLQAASPTLQFDRHSSMILLSQSSGCTG